MQAVDSGDHVGAAFLDLRKAFDSLNHMQYPFTTSLGVISVELRWFVNYLSNCMQHVKRGDQYSDWGLVLGAYVQYRSLLTMFIITIFVKVLP